MAIRKKNPLVSLIKTIMYNGLEQLGRYYSSYRGFVINNQDPEHLNRIQLLIPQITGQNVYEKWAYPKNNFSGTGYGAQVLPQIGDMVWVEFEGGHPEVPLWSHGHRGKSEVPDDEELRDPNCYWFKTPRGSIIKLNDTKNIIEVKGKLGDYVRIDEKGVIVEATKGKKVSIKNNHTSLHTIFKKMLTMYIKTKTVSGVPLSPDNIDEAVDLMVEMNKLLK